MTLVALLTQMQNAQQAAHKRQLNPATHKKMIERRCGLPNNILYDHEIPREVQVRSTPR